MKQWNNIIYKINLEGAFLDKTILSKYLDQFYLEIVDKIKDDQYILFIPRAILIDNQFISRSSKIEINKDR